MQSKTTAHNRSRRQPLDWSHATRAWLTLPWLASADAETLRSLGVSIPPSERLDAHLNRVTWLLGLALVIGMSVIGRGT